MPISQQLIHPFEELESQLKSINWRRSDGGSVYTSGDQWRRWATSAMHLIHTAFGEKSPHYVNFKAAYDRCVGYEDDFGDLKGVFLGASSDYREGYVFSVEASISCEVLGDFVAMAKLALAEGHKDVAAVLACAALEDTLKRFARLNGVDVDNKVLQDVVAALKS